MGHSDVKYAQEQWNKKKEIHKEIGIYLNILNGLFEDYTFGSPEWPN
jgi:hypothetical protein